MTIDPHDQALAIQICAVVGAATLVLAFVIVPIVGLWRMVRPIRLAPLDGEPESTRAAWPRVRPRALEMAVTSGALAHGKTPSLQGGSSA